MSRKNRRNKTLEELLAQDREEAELRAAEERPYLEAGCDPEDLSQAKFLDRETGCGPSMATYAVGLERRIELLEAMLDELRAAGLDEPSDGPVPAP